MTRIDILQIFREYENERVLVPFLQTRENLLRYSAVMWTINTMKNVVLSAYDSSNESDRFAAVLYHAEQFTRSLDHYATCYPPGEINNMFSTCYDIATDILNYFLV